MPPTLDTVPQLMAQALMRIMIRMNGNNAHAIRYNSLRLQRRYGRVNLDYHPLPRHRLRYERRAGWQQKPSQ